MFEKATECTLLIKTIFAGEEPVHFWSDKGHKGGVEHLIKGGSVFVHKEDHTSGVVDHLIDVNACGSAAVQIADACIDSLKKVGLVKHFLLGVNTTDREEPVYWRMVPTQ